MSKKPIADQVVVITGASSGIGLATARLAASRGARVVLGARDVETLTTLCAELEAAGGRARCARCDVGREEDVRALSRVALEHFGCLDAWVNVAGVGIIAPLSETTLASHRRLFETNYWGVVNGSLVAAEQFRAQQAAGAIINVGSAFSDLSIPTMGAYAASKFAVKAFSNALRVELRQEGLPVSVTLIKPSVIDSMFYDHAETTLDTKPWIPPPRYAPSVVAEAILDAAEHTRREIAVGVTAAMGGLFGALMPALVERSMGFMRERVWKDARFPKAPSTELAPREGQERSGRASARRFSLTATVQRNPWKTGLLVGGLLVGGLALARARR